MTRAQGRRPVLTFSGPFTERLDAHTVSVADAAKVRVTRRGYLILAVDPEADVLADETPKYIKICDDEVLIASDDVQDLAELRESLAVSQITGGICMCTGDLALEFLDRNDQPIDVLRIDWPDRLSWRMWLGDAQLAQPERLRQWLSARGLVLG